MKLSDVMSAMGLGGYAEVALVLFMAAFVAVAFQLFARRNAGEWERASRLPLDSSPDVPRTPRGCGSNDPS
jgi:cbb3-type cytochrome oxidase subunit 3